MRLPVAIIRLYCIHIFAFTAISLSTFFPGWDLILTGIYLAVLIVEGRMQSQLTLLQRCLTLFAWQGPAVFLGLYVLQEWVFWGLTDYAIFILQFWSAPLLPWWSLVNIPVQGQYPCDYYLILATPLLIAIWYLVATFFPANKKSAGDFK